MKQTGVKLITLLALLLVSLFLYGCSSSASPQTQTNVLVLEPEAQLETQAQVEAAPESVEEPAPQGDEVPQAKLDIQESSAEPAEAQAQDERAQSEPDAGFGAGAPESGSLNQVIPSPTPVSIPVATAPPPPVGQSAPSGEPTVGSQAPEFNLQTLDGQSLQLSALRGKNILLSYWVTWCIPCMEELPALNRIYQEYQARDVVILSVNGIKQDEMDKVLAALNELGISMPIAFDQDDNLWNTYWVRFLPTSFFINEDGVIRHIQLGSLTEEEFRTKLEKLISDQL